VVGLSGAACWGGAGIRRGRSQDSIQHPDLRPCRRAGPSGHGRAGLARPRMLHRGAASLLCRGPRRVRRHRPGSHTPLPRAAWKPGPAAGHALPGHRRRGGRCRGGKSQASSSASGSSDRTGAPLWAGHRRGSPRRKDALANPGDGVDRQLLVVPWNDHLTYSRPADPRKHRGPPHACPSPSEAILPSQNTPWPTGRMTQGSLSRSPIGLRRRCAAAGCAAMLAGRESAAGPVRRSGRRARGNRRGPHVLTLIKALDPDPPGAAAAGRGGQRPQDQVLR